MNPILAPVQSPTLRITSTGDEINIPGYHSLPEDRLAVFKDGSHGMFTDRLNTGGTELNPKVKAATRELAVAFFPDVFNQKELTLSQWAKAYEPLVARFDQRR